MYASYKICKLVVVELKDILEKKINQLGIKKQVTASQVCDAYNKAVAEIFGRNALKNTEAVSFRAGVLKVRTSSSALSQEIQGKSGEILERISTEKEGKKAEKIVFKVRKDE